MENRYREKWTREETILAFDLYCKVPFSKISKTNKEIIELANLLGRTPSSVGLKMDNLASFDPNLISQNIKGMQHASKLDKEIVEEFFGDWEELSYQAHQIISRYKQVDLISLNPEIEIEKIPEGSNVEKEVKVRVGQTFFRTSVLNSYENTCCVTGIKEPALLIASHIKPWRDSNPKTERTNPHNGLCLNSFHDRAFDKGFITLDKEYKIIISKRVSEVAMDAQTKDWFYSYENKQIVLPRKMAPWKQFIEYHNDVIFRG